MKKREREERKRERKKSEEREEERKEKSLLATDLFHDGHMPFYQPC